MMKRITRNGVCLGESLHLRVQTIDMITYLKAVEKAFDNERGKYDRFVAILQDLKAQRIDFEDFLEKMKQVLEGHDFLILGLNIFLPEGYKIPTSYEQRLNLHNNNNNNNVDKSDIQFQKQPMKKNKKPLNNETKKEVDLSKCERCNVSYVRLPEDYQSPISSGRSELTASLLNDRIVLNPQGVQNYSKSKRKFNKYRKALFDVEDKLFEADMLVESVSSACKCFEEENKIGVKKVEASVLNDRMELNPEGVQDYSKPKRDFNEYEKALFKVEHELLEMEMFIESLELASECLKEVYQKILENKNDVKKEGGFNIEEYFRISSLTLIEREDGVDDPEELRNNPTIALPKLLERIEEKRKELEHRRQGLNKVWAQCYAEIHAKSLQFRSS